MPCEACLLNHYPSFWTSSTKTFCGTNYPIARHWWLCPQCVLFNLCKSRLKTNSTDIWARLRMECANCYHHSDDEQILSQAKCMKSKTWWRFQRQNGITINTDSQTCRTHTRVRVRTLARAHTQRKRQRACVIRDHKQPAAGFLFSQYSLSVSIALFLSTLLSSPCS